MTAKHAPGTPLPFRVDGEDKQAMIRGDDATIVGLRHRLGGGVNERNMRYIAHACNAYPRLVETLRELMVRCDGDEGVRADGSNIQTMAAHALLDELGELE